MRALSAFGALLGGLAFLAIGALVTGGYVYQTKCPLPTGGTQTKWTYGIEDVLPYIRSTSPPCRSHPGTRVVLSAIGIWPLGGGGSPAVAVPEISASDRAAATSLEAVTNSLSAQQDREREELSKFRAAVKAQGVTFALRRRLVRMTAKSASQLRAVKLRLDNAEPASDSELAEAQRTLSRWLELEIQVRVVGLTAFTRGELARRGRELGREIGPFAARLQTLSDDIRARYPTSSAGDS